jgi:hypothetical protein
LLWILEILQSQFAAIRSKFAKFIKEIRNQKREKEENKRK